MRARSGIAHAQHVGAYTVDWVVDEGVSTIPSIGLPSLRYLKIKMASYTNLPALFLPGLLLPPDVRMDLNWDDVHGRYTRDILLRHLVGLHTSPFFDEMCVHLSGINSVVVNCFTGDVERLCVQEYSCSRGRLPVVLDEYTSAHVTRARASSMVITSTSSSTASRTSTSWTSSARGSGMSSSRWQRH